MAHSSPAGDTLVMAGKPAFIQTEGADMPHKPSPEPLAVERDRDRRWRPIPHAGESHGRSSAERPAAVSAAALIAAMLIVAIIAALT